VQSLTDKQRYYWKLEQKLLEGKPLSKSDRQVLHALVRDKEREISKALELFRLT
jgi:hypothetical protein